MSPKSATATDGRLALSEKTSQTDDQRIRDVTPLPPPEHLIRFFPIAGTPVETLVSGTRAAIRNIMRATTTGCWSSSARAPSTTRRRRWTTRAG